MVGPGLDAAGQRVPLVVALLGRRFDEGDVTTIEPAGAPVSVPVTVYSRNRRRWPTGLLAGGGRLGHTLDREADRHGPVGLNRNLEVTRFHRTVAKERRDRRRAVAGDRFADHLAVLQQADRLPGQLLGRVTSTLYGAGSGARFELTERAAELVHVDVERRDAPTPHLHRGVAEVVPQVELVPAWCRRRR